MSVHPPHIPNYIKQKRKERGLSQEALGEAIGVSHSTIGRLEKGKTAWHRDIMEAIAHVLECQVVDLLIRDPLAHNPLAAVWIRIPEEMRPQAVRMLQLFADSLPAAMQHLDNAAAKEALPEPKRKAKRTRA